MCDLIIHVTARRVDGVSRPMTEREVLERTLSYARGPGVTFDDATDFARDLVAASYLSVTNELYLTDDGLVQSRYGDFSHDHLVEMCGYRTIAMTAAELSSGRSVNLDDIVTPARLADTWRDVCDLDNELPDGWDTQIEETITERNGY